MKRRRSKLFGRIDERRLRLLFVACFIALAVPAAVLVAQAYSQLKWESFRGTQLAAEELASRINAELLGRMTTEEARSFGDYSFLIVEGDAAANFVQRSPLSEFPVQSDLPGVLGYFQVDSAGQLTTPLLPDNGVAAASYGIPAAEQAARAERVAELREILAQNQLVRPQTLAENIVVTGDRVRLEAPEAGAGADADADADAEAEAEGELEAELSAGAAAAIAFEAEPQAAFDRLRGASSSGARQAANFAPDDIGLTSVAEPVSDSQERRQLEEGDRYKRVEQALVLEAAVATEARADDSAASPQTGLRVRIFESEVDPFDFGMLDTGHFVLFRNVWREGQRYIQGAVIDRAEFLASVIEMSYRTSTLAGVSDLEVRLEGESLASLSAMPASRYESAPELNGTLLHRARLSPPFGDMELLFGVISLPRAAGTGLLAWVTVALAAVLCGGFFFMYRMAAEQMRLARQQQDFVSAVSHELKTPLTSIRMYGELLKSGWADDAKKQSYYDYIHSESERLSRLIDNVLQLARLTRSTQKLDMHPVAVSELMDMVRSKVDTQVERAGFELCLRNEAPPQASIEVDADCFAQIFINLVDNALKFAAAADTKSVEIACRPETGGAVLFTVRDYGPGVPKAQMKKIFELFYRPNDELTRDTVGTGIGLALVRQLADAMQAGVDVRNCEPGAEFRLRFAAPGSLARA